MIATFNEPQFDAVATFIDPGAGLRRLDHSLDSDFIFDSIFSVEHDLLRGPESQPIPNIGEPVQRPCPMVRVYGSDLDM